MAEQRLSTALSLLLLVSGLGVSGVLVCGVACRQEPKPTAEIAVDELRDHVALLASPELGGRLTGTEQERRAAEYLATQLEAAGLVPLPGRDDFLLPFEFTAGASDAGSTLEILAGDAPERFDQRQDIQALSFSDTGALEGEVVFVGYGLTVPESQDFGYDSYFGLDVRDKIAVALRYVPEDLEGDARATLNRYSGLRFKAMTARQNGAKALIIVTGPRSANAGEVVPMTFDTAISGSGIVAASISGAVAQQLFAAAGKELEAAQRALDDGNPHAQGYPLSGVRLALDVKVERERREGTNVVGFLPGDPAGLERPWVVVGGHFDHLGTGDAGNSLARSEEAGEIHTGADDNASGVAAIVEAAEALASGAHARNIAVTFWSGEELGLLGSSAFLDQAVLAPAQIAAYVNLDMVGRMRDNRLSAQGVGSSAAWPGLLERLNVTAGFDLELQDDPYLPTDSAAFYGKEVPTLNLFTGSHADYHRPSDRADTLNYEDLQRVSELTARVVGALAAEPGAPVYAKVERQTQQGGDRDTVRAFTGTIPDYTTEVDGLLLSGVIGGGPAEAAGLREGDVIVRFGKHEIKNIYDYTYALDAVKVGEPLEVELMRAGERVKTTIVPTARD
jgi:Zn-dependent M28 family amino/carboxypeptidase